MRRSGLWAALIPMAVIVISSLQTVQGQWFPVDLDGYDVRGIAFRTADCDTVYAAVYYNDRGIYRSTDMGQSWVLAGSLAWANDLSVSPVDPDVIYAIFRDAIYTSLDAGDNWLRKDSGFSFGSGYGPADIAASMCSADTVYMTTSAMTGGGKLYCSPDQSDNWNEIGMPWPGRKGALGLPPTSCSILYVSVGSPEILAKSGNGGGSWSEVFAGYVDDVSVDSQTPNNIFIASDGEIHRSQDGGDSWTIMGASDGITDYVRIVTVNPVNPSVVYAAGGNSVFRSSDGGFQWFDFSDGLTESTYINSVAVDGESGEVLLVGTYKQGIYRRTDSLAGVDPGAADTHSDWLSLTVAPNPLLSPSVISFSLRSRVFTAVEIFDATGRKVETLMRGRLDAGDYQCSWGGKGDSGRLMAPGIYFVRLRAGNSQSVRRAVLLK